MKIPFDIKYRPQIESGEYKVCSRTAEPVRIIEWNRKGNFPIIALMGEDESRVLFFNEYGHQSKRATIETGDDLFTITPELELTDFEREFKAIVEDEFGAVTPVSDADVHKSCEKLLELAREELCKNCKRITPKEEGEAYMHIAGKMYEKGKAEGKREVLEKLPKWRKSRSPLSNQFGDIWISDNGITLWCGGWEVPVADLINKLPKE